MVYQERFPHFSVENVTFKLFANLLVHRPFMEQLPVPSVFEDIHDPTIVRRKYMIPKWIRVGAWIVVIACPPVVSMAIIAIIQGNEPFSFMTHIYGESGELITIATLAGLTLKGTAAIGLLAEKNWAVKVAIADGIADIALSVCLMLLPPHHLTYGFLLTTIYLVKMFKIRRDWEENRYAAGLGHDRALSS